MNLSSAIVAVEAGHVAVEGRAASRTASGIPYVTITSGGEKHQGERMPGTCKTEAGAIRAWVREIKAYIGERPCCIHWRRRPEMLRLRGRFAVCARLAAERLDG